MLAEIAVFALALALALSLIGAGSLVSARLHTLLQGSALVGALLVFVAFVILIILRLDSDFTVANVAEHSNHTLPLLYKVAGTWGNHEGSMLLWALVVCGFGAILSARHPLAAAVQSLLAAGVLLFILATSNPFARIFPPPPDGSMLNPLLQDVALAMHPPLLYLGYVGFSAVFSLAVAGLITRQIDARWATTAQPWIMAAWASLTCGIALGSWWAYRELGWGGFWFWDPVENASLLPWLAATALLHSNVVLKKRGALAGWVALLAIITFGLSLVSTFLVRSGAITSVHSFASDPERGLFILAYIALVVGGALWLYAAHVRSLPPTAPMRPASREGVIVINNLFLLTACATVLLGTIYPMLAEAIGGGSVSVGAPFYHRTFLPLMALPLFFAGLAPFLPWKKAAPLSALRRAWPGLAAACAAATVVMATIHTEAVLAAASLALAGFMMVASAQWLAAGKWRLPANWPVFLGHSGAALLVIGITGAGLWGTQVERNVNMGDTLSIAGYDVNVVRLGTIHTPNYDATQVTLDVTRAGHTITQLQPEARRYGIRDTTTSEAEIYSTAAYDLYAVVGAATSEGEVALRLYHKPAVSFLWLGAAFITAGGILSAWLAGRRKYP